MNRLAGFGIAVVLCMAAAGFGAYMALRPQPGAVPVSATGEAGASTAQAPAGQAGLSAPAVPVPPDATPAPSASVAPAAVKSPRPAAAAPPKTAPSETQRGGADTGGAAIVPPASQNPVAAETAPQGGSAGSPPAVVAVPPAASEPVIPQPPPPPQKVVEELVVSADSVIGLRVESTVSSEVAKVEDPVESRVTRDVRVGPEIAIPAGSRILGSVIYVERGGKMKTSARIGVRFHTLVLPDNTRTELHTEAIYREGKSPGQETAAKVGVATMGGAILGAIVGGGKGAAIGGAVGAAGGTGVAMAGGRNPAVLASGTSLTVRLSQPVTVIVERNEFWN